MNKLLYAFFVALLLATTTIPSVTTFAYDPAGREPEQEFGENYSGRKGKNSAYMLAAASLVCVYLATKKD